MAVAETYVRPGQTDVTLTVEIENEADSGADIASAQVDGVPSEGAPVTNIRISPAVAVPVGQTKTFTITFDIAGTANDGPFTMTLKDIIEDAVDPDPAANDTQVSLTVDRSTPREIAFAITPSERVGNLLFTSSKRPRISAVFEDDLSGMDTNYFRIGLGRAGEEPQPITNPEIGLGSLGLTFSPSFDLDDGNWAVGYVLQDLAGNVFVSSHAFTVDTATPIITLVNAGAVALGAGWATSSIGVTVGVTDYGSGLARLEVYIGDPDAGGERVGENHQVYSSSHVYTGSEGGLETLASLPERAYYLVATDGAGNRGKAVLFVDRSPPLVTLSDGDIPDSRSFIGSDLASYSGDSTALPPPWARQSVQAFVMDDVAGVVHIRVSHADIPGGTAYEQSFSDPAAMTVGLVNWLADRQDYLAVAEDFLGHRTSFWFSVDKGRPTVDISRVTMSRSGDEHYYVVEGTGTDALSGVASAELPPGRASQSFASPGTSSATFTLGPVPIFQGPQDVTVFDAAGNLARGRVYVDTNTGAGFNISLEGPVMTASQSQAFGGGMTLQDVSIEITAYETHFDTETVCPVPPTDIGKVEVYAWSEPSQEWSYETPQAEVAAAVESTPRTKLFESGAMGKRTTLIEQAMGQKLTLEAIRSTASIICEAVSGGPSTGIIAPVASVRGTVSGVTVLPYDSTAWQPVALSSSVFVFFNRLGVLVHLENVDDDGDMLVRIIPGFPPPPNTTKVGPGSAWDITTTAEFTGAATITVKYDPGPLGLEPDGQDAIRMLHYLPDGGYEDVTVAVNTAERTVTGRTYSLSPFTLVVPNEFVHRPDKTPPTTTLSFVGPAVGNSSGNVVISQFRTSVKLTPLDPIVEMERTSGEATTYYLVDWTPEQCGHAWGRDPLEGHGEARGVCDNPVYGGEFLLAEGTHTIYYGSRDMAGNLEPMASAYITVDGTPPDTQPSYSGPVAPYSGGGYILGPQTSVRLVPTDPSSRGVSVGVATTYYLVDLTLENCSWAGGLEPVVDTPEGPPGSCSNPFYRGQEFTLTEGSHTLTYVAVDWLGNLGMFVSTNVAIDATPPDTAFIPQGPNDIDEQGRMVISSNTPISLTASDPVVNGVSAGVGKPWFLVDVQPSTCAPGGSVNMFPPYVSTATLGSCQNYIFFPTTVLTLPEGQHKVRYYSRDRVGNTKDWTGQPVDSDSTPPVTNLSIQGSSATLDNQMVVSSQTYIVLTATDPVSGGVNAGFLATVFLLNNTAESCHWGNEPPHVSTAPPGSCDNPFYSSSFSFTLEGANTLGYLSLDKVANREALQSLLVLLDAAPPEVFLTSPAREEVFVAGRDTVTISFAVDDAYDQAPIVEAALVHASGSSVPVVSGQSIDPGSLLDGFWELRVSAVDFVQNSTIVVSGKFEVIRDNLPPRTSLVLGQPSVPGDPAWVKTTTPLTLDAKDDAVAVRDERGLGVARTSYSVVPGVWLEYSSAGFHLSGEGPHDVAYQSVDVLGHVEEVKVSSVSVDETPPSIAFTQPAANAILNTASPTILLSYSDTGSGIDPNAFTIRIDGVDLSLQASANGSGASLTPPSVGQGSHTATASIADRLGNRRSVSLSFFVDSINPLVTMTKPLGTYVNSKRPTMEGIASDYGSGLNTSSITMRLDGSSVPAQVTGAGGGDGAPGPWLEAATLPTGLLAMASVVSDGMLYISGGFDAGPSGFSKAVRYASIGPGGVLGDWQAGQNLLQGVRGHKMVAADGNLIVLGGYVAETNSTTRDVLVAPINAVNGSLGSWVKSDFELPFVYGEQNFAATVINGYLYVMGGENNPYGQVSSKVYFTKLCPQQGLCAGWTETTPLPGPLDQIVAVTVGDTLFLYVPGGAPTGSGGIRQVIYNKPDPTRGAGHLGTWQYTTEMPRAVTNYAAVGTEGHIYVLGGTPQHEPVKTVDFAAVNPDGTVGNWTEDPRYDLPKALSSFSAVAWDGRIFVVGGQKGPAEGWGMSNKVYSSLVRSDVPVVMATATYVPMADLAEGDHTIVLSADDKAGNRGTGAIAFKIDTMPPTLTASAAGKALGVAEPWVNTARPLLLLEYADAGSGIETAALTIALDGVDITASAQIGPVSASFTPASDLSQGPHTLMASISDGAGNVASISVQFKVDSILPQVAISTPANGVYFATSTVHMVASYGDGGSGLSTGTIQLSLNGIRLPAHVDHSGGGAEQQGLPGRWSAAGSMPSGLLGMASAVWNGVLYVSGGTDGSGPGFRREVRYASIGAGGVLGDWHDGPNLPQGVRGHRMVAVAGMLISMGGYVAETNQTTREVLVSRIQADGRPGDWQSQPAFLLPFFYGEQNFAATVLNGFLYVMGGENNPYGQVSSQVHFVRVCPQEPSGLCGAWTATTSLPGPLDQIVAVTVGNTLFLYVPGGSPTGSGGISQVLYNTPRTDGSGQLNEWLATTPMPRQVTNYAAVGAEGHIYVLGGTPMHEPVNTVDFAAVNPNGTVGTWTEDPQYYLPKPLMWASAVTWDGRIFVVGGQHGPADGWSISDKVYASLVRVDAAIASATATYTATLTQDHYTLSAVTQDLADNVSSSTIRFDVDWTPPDSSLVVDAASRSFAGRLYVQGQPPLGILAFDAVSGVQERRLQVDGGDFGVIEGAFPLGQGNHELAFFSTDKAGNVESTKTAAIKLDAVAPAAVGDLLAVLPSTHSLTLTWTAPGDDGLQGTILSGELLIQYEGSAVGFSTAQAQLVISLAGLEPAATQSLTLAGLSQGTEYSVALWTRDTAGNYSPISNTAAARTLSATQSADQLVSLYYPDAEVSVSSRPPAEVPGALSISIDQGLSMAATAFYELTSPSGEPITFSTPAVLRFLFDSALVDPELVAIYKYADLDGDGQWTWTSEPIANQARAPVAEPPGWWQITGEIYSASLFGVFQRRTDSSPPVTTAALGEPKFAAFGMWFAAPGTLVTLTVADADSDVRSAFYRIDSGQVLEYAAPFPLGQGTHRVEYWAEDRAGNIESIKSLRVGVSYLRTAAMTGSEGITGSGTSQAAGTLLSNGKVALSGNVRVVGDVTGSPVIRSGKASITGAISQAGAGAAPEPIDLALVEQGASATDSSALIPPAFLKNGALVLTGNNTLTLATGTYMLKGLNLSGNAMLEAAGPVSIFVDGAIQVLGNARLNAGGNASRLVVFSKAASAITFSGGAQVLGLVYAPKAPVELAGSARIGGSLYAKAVVFSGTARLAVGEVLPPESLASGGGGGRTADGELGTVPGDSRIMAAADPAFILRDLYAFPNPAVGGAKPVIHAAVGIADRVLVKIFDVSGRQTQEATLDGSPQIVDDGSGPKYAYEYTWDGHIPSGVYFYTIEAEKSGEKIRKAGRLAVVR